MTLSDLAVRRPVFAAVAAIILTVVGLAAFTLLPVRELPSVDPPQVSIGTSYRGASAEVVEERITQVIEQQVAGIQGIDRISSVSRDGQSRINIAFTLDRSLDDAANDVRDAVSRVQARLPDQADPPTIAKANADASPILLISLKSTEMSRLQLTDYANRYLVERLSTIPGVASVGVGGGQNYSMRIWLNAGAMAARGVTVQDVQTALNTQNLELPAGSLESNLKDYTVRVQRQYSRPEDFAALPVPVANQAAAQSNAATTASTTSVPNTTGNSTTVSSGPSAYVTRLGDIARIEEGPDERRRSFRSNGQDMVGIQILRQSQANDLDISKNVTEAVKEINRSLPKGTVMAVGVDFSVFTAEAIHEVWITMALSLALVALVNFVFLGSWRSAIIPTIVAPICVISSFIVLAPLGFSINLLTLLALVLAIGLVVDDAIVVVENIQRRVDEGEPPLVAAERGARQVFFAIIAVTAVLITVFAPLMFMPGYIGKLFVELAVAVASAIFFSAVLALSLSPMLASKLLRPAAEGFIARNVNKAMGAVRDSYAATLAAILPNRLTPIVVGVLVLILAAGAGGLYQVLPKELVPNEDRGRIDVNINGPEGAGFDYTMAVGRQIETMLAKYVKDGRADTYTMNLPGFGGGSFNSGSGNLSLVGWKHRKESADEVAQELNRAFGSITGARVNASVRSPIQRGGPGGGGNNITLIAKGDEYDNIYRWLQPILRSAQENPGFTRPRINYEPTSPRLLVRLDREKAAALGVQPQAVGAALQTMLGSARVTTYIKSGQEYDVLLQTDLEHRRTDADLQSLYVRTNTGALVPLSNVVSTEVRGDTPDRGRTDRQRAISLSADLVPGYTVGEGIKFFEDEVAKQPPGPVITWGGTAKDYLDASGSMALAFGLALLLVFLVLAAQFESWIHPAVIMLTVPLAALGGLFGLLIAGSSLNTYSQVGLIILVGIAAKNGILIVEFANQLRDEGRSVMEAIIESASVRLRPIVMTSIASGMGALPLIFARGPGANSRETIGVVIASGAIFSTVLTLFVVPVFYNLLGRFTKSPLWTQRQIEAFETGELAHAEGSARPPAAAE
ncbi:MAG: efflux transporter permease subunit [Caulobacteraceae bacterium]|nr:efflux transporter permease subunit [Caulobacteraceae bacterium]